MLILLLITRPWFREAWFKPFAHFVVQSLCPLNPPILGDFRNSQSPAELGDLGGFQGL
jgi:hypothetical protein